ncbi:ABC transporter ATP-binding protein, partial [Nonomuraea fuscirosea]
GRAIVRDAGAYLLDEPLSNLDAQLRVLMRAEIKRLHVDVARTFIYVTHDQVEAMTMSDRIAVMRDGVVQQCATPGEIYERPANRFVASFMGSPPMNFVTGELADVDGVRVFRGGELTQELGPYDEAPDDPAVVLGVRPEDVTLSPTPVEGYQPGKVFVSEPLGPDVLVTVRIGGELLKARVPVPFRLGHDSTVYAGFNRERLHLFKAADGTALHAPS